MKKNQDLTSFLKEVSTEIKQRRINDIGSFLILPIQRLMRYKMLLEDLFKRIHDEKMKEKLQKAVEEVSQVAIYCNDKQTEFIQMQRMKELGNLLNIKVIQI
jgi:hypothetical protein